MDVSTGLWRQAANMASGITNNSNMSVNVTVPVTVNGNEDKIGSGNISFDFN